MSRRATAERSARDPLAPSMSPRLRIDPGVCDGVGICAHLAPDLVTVDSWGYPIISQDPLTHASDRRQAQAAVSACPRKALYLD
jgi:ferredoxin